MENLNILVEAKKEYTGELCKIMCPQIISVFDDMLKEAEKNSKRGEVVMNFQKYLKEVKDGWTEHMVKKHVDSLVNTCGWFRDLLAAVFVSHVKILSAVRLKAENKKIALTLPTNGEFVHACYENCARYIYNHTELYTQESVESKRDKELTKIFTECIEETIRSQIPVQKILQTYIAQDNKDDNMEFGEDEEDTADPDVLEEPPPVEETIEEPLGEPQVEPLGELPQEPPSVEETPQEEVKDVPVSTKGLSQEDEELLFPDAPDKLKKP